MEATGLMLRVEKKTSSLAQRSDNMHSHQYPVIHIGRKSRILYANKAAFPILAECNCLTSDYLPDQVVSRNPDILRMDAGFKLQLNTRFFSYRLDVVGFKESGYIGLYGFSSISIDDININESDASDKK